MQSRARLLSHPIHQILIVFPLGLLTTSIVFDIIGLVTLGSQWTYIATYMVGAGVIGGIAAAIAGLIDYRAIPRNTRARSVGAAHGLASVTVLLLFGVSALLRVEAPSTISFPALAFSLAGAGCAAVAGWLGGELVTRMGLGVDDDAGLNAVSSFAASPTRTASAHYVSSGQATPPLTDRGPVPGQSQTL